MRKPPPGEGAMMNWNESRNLSKRKRNDKLLHQPSEYAALEQKDYDIVD